MEELKGSHPLAPVAGDVSTELKRSKTQLGKQTAAKPSEKSDTLSAEALSLKQKNCKAAQANLITYQMDGRIARVDDKGERAILSSSEIAQAKIEAQADVKQYCE
ncbi:MAG: hypothetical protein LAC66_00815 [Methylotenera sp.]|nr:hypothetical protein [Methylotenera sp.]